MVSSSKIVKGMLEHSRSGDGNRESTNINELADEYLRLTYHGLRRKDNSFNANFETNLDKNLPEVKVIPQDLGRVLLNLINNAFYAVSTSEKLGKDSYDPRVTVTTETLSDQIQVKIKDNGDGISAEIKEKIFQPFFTTKPTGEGTGLGLSLSFDIIKKGHEGNITVKSKQGVGTEFIIVLPIN